MSHDYKKTGVTALIITTLNKVVSPYNIGIHHNSTWIDVLPCTTLVMLKSVIGYANERLAWPAWVHANF